MCNLYNQTTAVEAMRHLFDGLDNRAGLHIPTHGMISTTPIAFSGTSISGGTAM